MPPTRRTLLRVAATAPLLAPLTACATERHTHREPGETVTLDFWSWVPGMDAAVDLWNQKNPYVQIELSVVAQGRSGGYAKIRSALESGDPPDLAQIE